mmetsp:Transcript_33562/g.56352  ORF Transcript_33562/g.56352 Transcript_33562/m.56352 type:complete len:404 (-) Transcript_33562:260-1471(-)|eukprot:CAMPEP_0198198834 /NCGR_PEP_ID=MMETSP1445-20131203/2201_1 /TAXON_ID=36898 /ORGANISM="Pyramimonas sp., Strain CCMP2087" /LENGTH=403 /DNA_ID=CAMNT_0043868481 /DNA_START=824 /DNA_END=2035 /DNA_ORIENTATION=-
MATTLEVERQQPKGPFRGLFKRLQLSRPHSKRAAPKQMTGSYKEVSSYKEVAVVEVSAPPPKRLGKALPSLNEVFAGGAARGCSQAVIHPLDTFKVRMQTMDHAAPSKATGPTKASKQVLSAASANFGTRTKAQVGTLYKGVGGAAAGAGIAIGAYFAFYSAATNYLRENSDMPPGAVAFAAGGFAALSSSFVKVPLAVCIRSVQAGVYPNPFVAARTIVKACGKRGLFTGLIPTVLEDIPDMAIKFASYEMLQGMVKVARRNKPDNAKVSAAYDLAIGGSAGALAAAGTTPFDVVKTRMMCTASQRPTVLSAARDVYKKSGAKGFYRGIGPRSVSSGINSAVFFCFYEALRQVMREMTERRQRQEDTARFGAATAVQPLHVNPPVTHRPVEASLNMAINHKR